MVRRPGRDRPDVSAFLALFEHKIRDQSRLSLPEVQAIAAYLSTSVAEFSVFSHADAVLKACALPLPYPTLPEVQAIAAYLSTSVVEFSVFSHADAVLKARALPLPYTTLHKARAHTLSCLCMGRFSTVVWLVVALESFPRLVLRRWLACQGAKACLG